MQPQEARAAAVGLAVLLLLERVGRVLQAAAVA
jgi:hypothetical protein